MAAADPRPADAAVRVRLRHRAEYLLLRLIAGTAALLPRFAQVRLGRLIGVLGYRLIGRRRKLALANLQRCLPELSDAKRKTIARETFAIFGQVLVDGLLHSQLIRKADSLIEYRGLEHIRDAYARGKGVFLFSAHFGNWEMIALNQGRLGMSLLMVVRALDNPLLEAWFIKLRTTTGNRIAYKKAAVKEMLRAVHDQIGVAILIDQAYTGEGSLAVEFFGQSAPTVPTLGLLARKTGAAVVPVFSVPGRDGRYTVTYGAALELPESDDRDHDVQAITQSATSCIEQAIRENPHCWLWMHNRFKGNAA
jgi:KDO2-lipid IV(A) lauroyltransferase